MSQSNFDKLINRHFPKATILDDVATAFHLNGYTPLKALQKGIYLFVDGIRGPDIVVENWNDKFHLIARAVCVVQLNGEWLAHIAEFNISTLISSLSTLEGRKASTLYGVPEENDDNAWNKLKRLFIETKLLGTTVKIYNSSKQNSVDWSYCLLTDLPAKEVSIKMSGDLGRYLADQDFIVLLTQHLK